MIRRPGLRRRIARLIAIGLAALAFAIAHSEPSSATDHSEMSFMTGGEDGHRFDLLEPSYFITGTDHNESADVPLENDQVRFKLAVRYRLMDMSDVIKWLPVDLKAQLHFAYTQDAFWNLYDESAPFYENNFTPEAYVFLHPTALSFATGLGVRHQSNGRDGDLSRSWNRYYATFAFGDPYKNAFFGTVTAWGTWGVGDENPDITDYKGQGEAVVYFAPGALWTPTRFHMDRLGLQIRLPLAGKEFIPAFEGTLLFRIQKEAVFSPSVVIQYFDGTGHTLRDYNKDVTVWRAGLGFWR